MEKKRRVKKRLDISVSPEYKDLGGWYKSLNHNNEKYENIREEFRDTKVKSIELNSYKINGGKEKEEVALLSLIFQLNQLLMLLNNPIPFPHQPYVEMFKNHQ